MPRTSAIRALILALAGLIAARAGAAEGPVEWKVFPVIAGSSDVGVLLGALAQVARPGLDGRPYEWMLKGQFARSVKQGPTGWRSPVADHFFEASVLDVGPQHLRLRATFAAAEVLNAGFYGLGNAATERGTTPHRHEYAQDELHGALEVRWPIGKWRVAGGVGLRSLTPSTYAGSRLAEDLEAAPGLFNAAPRTSLQGLVGLERDTRDSEIAPTAGTWAGVLVRVSKGFESGVFSATSAFARGFVPVSGDRLVLGLRAAADVLAGDVPLDELAHPGAFTEGVAIGGGDGVRGLPEGRFQGRVRVLAGAELRVAIAATEWFGERVRFGAVVFGEGGRTWAELGGDAALDGDGPGMHGAAGGGLRLHWGETVLVRFDVGWAPEARDAGPGAPIGVYFDLGHAF